MNGTIDGACRRAKEQQDSVARHVGTAYVEACPGAGKTLTMARRLGVIAPKLSPRTGIAVLSFTNMAVDEFQDRCASAQLAHCLRYPSFVGTFDRFIFQFIVAPFGIPGSMATPRLLESWEGYTVSVSGIPLVPIPLTCFDAGTCRLNLDDLPYQVSRPLAEQHMDRLEARAKQIRARFARRGVVTTAECRLIARANISDAARGFAIGKALASRFAEIIIDEAQDCNEIDITILRWLSDSGIPLIVVCDPDQAIFGFRGGSPAGLSNFIKQFTRLEMVGNFRSSPVICRLAASMRLSRPDPDLAVGPNGAHQGPIHLIGLAAAGDLRSAGERFLAILGRNCIDPPKAIVLAHQRRACAQAAGASIGDSGRSSLVARLALCVAEIRCAASEPMDRGRGLRHLMRLILEIEGRFESEDTLAGALERHGLSERDMRRRSLELFAAINEIPTDHARGWLERVRVAVADRLVLPSDKSVNQAFRSGDVESWISPLKQLPATSLRWATVHEAKGRAYDAVCLVIPKPRAPFPDCVDLWEARADDEALRVLYVGATRAKRLLAIAVPSDNRVKRVCALLDKHGVEHVIS